MMQISLVTFFFYILSFLLVACHGQPSKEPPIVPIQNMYVQSKHVAQSTSDFYKDGRSARPPVQGTVQKNSDVTNTALNDGLESFQKKDSFIKNYPFKMTKDDLKSGQ